MHYDIFSVGAPEVRRNCFNRTVTGGTSVLALLGELVGREWPGIRFVNIFFSTFLQENYQSEWTNKFL